MNGSNGRYPGAWTAGSESQDQPGSSTLTTQPQPQQPVDNVEEVKTDDSPEVPTDTSSTGESSSDGSNDSSAGDSGEVDAEIDNSPSVKNKDDEIKEEFEKEYERLGK